MSEKPHHGRIALWTKVRVSPKFYVIEGYALDRKGFNYIRTTKVASHDAYTDEIETVNSRYKLTCPADPWPGRPRWLTFTGADNTADIPAMIQLTKEYPIEWAFLLSVTKEGQSRYPTESRLRRMIVELPHRAQFAYHLCGEYSRQVLTTGRCMYVENLMRPARVQINTTISGNYHPISECAALGTRIGSRVILQYRDDKLPDNDTVDWLYDRSAGKGIEIDTLPMGHDSNRLAGYAGGINHLNVRDVIKKIRGETVDLQYWLDMESGLRHDGDDTFSVDKCRKVCEEVYGYEREV
jgi:hypothetical protein